MRLLDKIASLPGSDRQSAMARSRDLVIQGKLGYQPFALAEDLQTGVGYEWFHDAEGAGLVWCPAVAERYGHVPELQRILVDDAIAEAFVKANARLRGAYEYFLDVLWESLGRSPRASALDVGCNSGYFPLGLARRGARGCVGWDREDYSQTINLLAGLLEVEVGFRQLACPVPDEALEACEFDLAISCMLMCHLSDPLRHLADLGALSRRSVFIWTLINDDDDISIHYGPPNLYYSDDPFPGCFDNFVRPSRELLETSLKRMGFGEIRSLDLAAAGLPETFIGTRHVALLASRS